jgi:hypothetical protein
LGAVLRSALHALQEDRPVTLRVGACTDVAVCAPPPPPPPPRLAVAVGGMPPPPPLRPYLALLPLEDPEAIAQQLPEDASPLLVRLVRAANPLNSFEQLEIETGIQMSMLLGLTSHLQLWGKMRVIHPLTHHSVLCVRPDAPLEPSADFRHRFGEAELSYAELLSLFSPAQRFGAVIRAAEAIDVPKGRLVHMTIALLQRDALHTLHTYVHCVAEPPSPDANSDDAAISRWRLYRRLRPMFHGEHHLEEIVWQEKLPRESLDDLLDAYKQYLVTCVTHEAQAR